jgi:hypothetical protein
MATEIYLKNRETKGSIQVPFDLVKGIIDREDKDSLFDLLKNIADIEPTINDIHWLETIINWVPKEGAPVMQMAKWFALAKRVSKLEPDREGAFTLSMFETDLVWNRLSDEKFVVERMPQQFIEFLVDFAEAAGRQFPGSEEYTDTGE